MKKLILIAALLASPAFAQFTKTMTPPQIAAEVKLQLSNKIAPAAIVAQAAAVGIDVVPALILEGIDPSLMLPATSSSTTQFNGFASPFRETVRSSVGGSSDRSVSKN